MIRYACAVVVLFLCTLPAAADVWDEFIDYAEQAHGADGAAAARFLAEQRPPRDADIDLQILTDNLDYAMRARREFSWAANLDVDLFHNDVLPYACVDETRENWRPELYEIAAKIVRDARCTAATEAAQAINREFFNVINVHYNTGRKKPNQSPSESIAQSRATCTGLSILLVDACRSVGVPARLAGVAAWNGKNGNHTWVEVWDGRWFFTGADEYNPVLNRAWFNGDASRAIPGDPLHGVFATSWRRTGAQFTMAWNQQDTTVPGVDVTVPRYVEEAPAVADASSRVKRYFRAFDERGGQRIPMTCTIHEVATGATFELQTRAGQHDLNDMPSLQLLPDSVYRVVRQRSRDNSDYGIFDVLVFHFRTTNDASKTIELYHVDFGLDESGSDRFLQLWKRGAETHSPSADEDPPVFTHGDHTLKLLEKTFGEEPEGGHSLWISMHGGGGAPAHINDRQWKNQIRLYTLEEGIYVAPRAPTDTWNLWHQAHIDPLFDQLIAHYVTHRNVNPNRVYLLGYSAGGDGVYQLAPRMADRFAAAAMMAGHPNETQPLGLRNLPFALFMGGEDAAYDRNKVAARFGEALASLKEADPEGYPHRVTIYEGLGHWMDGRDAEGLPWMAEHTRDPWPSKVVWHQDDVTHTRFYWLAVRPEDAKARTTVTAEVKGQEIHITSTDVTRLRLRLRDALIDLDNEIVVIANGTEVFRGFVPRTSDAIMRSFDERLDAPSAATAELEVSCGE